MTHEESKRELDLGEAEAHGPDGQLCDRCDKPCFDLRQLDGERTCILCVSDELANAEAALASERARRAEDHARLDGFVKAVDDAIARAALGPALHPVLSVPSSLWDAIVEARKALEGA